MALYLVKEWSKPSWIAAIYEDGLRIEVHEDPEKLDDRVKELRAEGHGVRWDVPGLISLDPLNPPSRSPKP